jgi:hypothetical protein
VSWFKNRFRNRSEVQALVSGLKDTHHPEELAEKVKTGALPMGYETSLVLFDKEAQAPSIEAHITDAIVIKTERHHWGEAFAWRRRRFDYTLAIPISEADELYVVVDDLCGILVDVPPGLFEDKSTIIVSADQMWLAMILIEQHLQRTSAPS